MSTATISFNSEESRLYVIGDIHGCADLLERMVVAISRDLAANPTPNSLTVTLGDYIAVGIVGGKTQMLGNIIYGQLVTANNQPLAAALSIIPLVAIIAYLLAMRRTGALENV